jgi:hypothetical protein
VGDPACARTRSTRLRAHALDPPARAWHPKFMRSPHTARRWLWAAVALQLGGFLYDAVWHGLLHPGGEPQTRHAMVIHLGTVHLPLYAGVLSVFVMTLWALVDEIRRSSAPRAWWVAAFGALLSLVGEAWHAVTHLQLDTHAGAVAGSLSPVGLILVVAALWRAGRVARRDAAEGAQRRAA